MRLCCAPYIHTQLDIPFSEAFYKWMLGMESTFTAQDLQVRGVAMSNRGVPATTVQPMQHVDPVMARSFSQLAEVAVKKHNLERDSLLVSPVENITSQYIV